MRTWYTDEMFFFRGQDKWYLYRAVDEHGQVVDVLLREHRDTASAEAFFAQALGRSGQPPNAIITDHHQPYVKAIQRTVPTAVHIRSGLHRRDWRDDQVDRAQSCADAGSSAFLAWVEDACAPASAFLKASNVCARCVVGTSVLADLLPGSALLPPASRQDHVRTVAAAVLVLGMRLNRNPRTRRR